MGKVNFRVLSTVKCVVCGTLLKQNLINAKPNADMCYKHYQMIIRKNQLTQMDTDALIYVRRK